MGKIFDKPNFAATMMAGVPYRDIKKAIQVILENFPEAPCLPVMTRTIKWMLEGIPCLVIDRKKRQFLFDLSPSREKELLEFYDKYYQEDLDFFATTPQTAPFFYAMLEKLKEVRPPEMKWVVFHTSGPVTLGNVIKQLNGNPSFYHETLRDVLIKAINMKVRWMENKIKKEIPGVEVIVDMAEPTLVNFTSAIGSGTREEIINAINEGFMGLTCLSWIHCCSNIDWSLLTDSNVNVINIDAYQHSGKVALYPNEFKDFLERGGMIGWGIVPVIEELLIEENVPSLINKLEHGIDLFVSRGIDERLLISSSWVLPSCETVLLTSEQSDLVFGMAKEISRRLRSKYRFNI